jgi:hypothetical protein
MLVRQYIGLDCHMLNMLYVELISAVEDLHVSICKFQVWRGDRLCGLVARVPGYRSRGPGYDSRRYQIF